MFRVVIDNRNTAALELWSGQDIATIFFIDRYVTNQCIGK